MTYFLEILNPFYVQKTIKNVSDHFVEKIRHESTTLTVEKLAPGII